jgi:hypothetical protein
MGSSGYRYDAFISHAVEDKIPIANELCERLRKEGLCIWYSGKELSVGDSINTTIHTGLDQSRFGIVILSHNYLRKNWPRREFYTLLSKEKNGNKVVLPVLHEITPEELALEDLDMANRFAIKADRGLDYVVDKLIEVIRKEPLLQKKRIGRQPILATSAVIAVILAFYGFYAFVRIPGDLTDDLIHNEVQRRIDSFQQKVDRQYLADLRNAGAQLSEPVRAGTLYNEFRDVKSYYRNEYELFNGYKTTRGRKNVEAVLGFDLSTFDPSNLYQLQSPAVYLFGEKPEVRYAFVNTQQVQYTVSSPESIGDHVYSVSVTYKNSIRLVAVNLLFVKRSEETKRHRMFLLSLLPTETYVFEKKGNVWEVVEVK